jgi:hypothetical protein
MQLLQTQSGNLLHRHDPESCSTEAYSTRKRWTMDGYELYCVDSFAISVGFRVCLLHYYLSKVYNIMG